MDPVSIKAPDGSTLKVPSKNLLWLRQLNPHETFTAGAVSIVCLADGTIYSTEAAETLSGRFGGAECKLAVLTPPQHPDQIWINVMQVEQVLPANASLYPGAHALIKFSVEDFVAVREAPDVADAAITNRQQQSN